MKAVTALSAALLACGCGGSDEAPRPEPGGMCSPIALDGSDDPGSGPVDCSALDAYEIALLDDFETGAASGWYTNNDRSALQEPLPDSDPVPGAEIPGLRCGSRYAVHVRTGMLTDYGGTLGRNFRRLLDAEPCPIRACVRPPPPPPVGACGVGQPTPGQEEASERCITGIDASAWEGIVLWARKGPGSGSSLRVSVTDPLTDSSNQACVCNPFTNQNDTSDGCDKFGTYFTVDHTWRPFFLPFAEMQQGGWGMPSPGLDTSGLFSIAVEYGRGEWDLWIDDIGFYRRKP